jgi:hypothetical protein
MRTSEQGAIVNESVAWVSEIALGTMCTPDGQLSFAPTVAWVTGTACDRSHVGAGGVVEGVDEEDDEQAAMAPASAQPREEAKSARVRFIDDLLRSDDCMSLLGA